MISPYFKEPSLQTHFIVQGANVTDTFYSAYYESFDIYTNCFRPPVRKIISQRSDWHDNFGSRSEITSQYFKKSSVQTHSMPQGANLTDTCYTAYYEPFDISSHCFRARVRKIISKRSDWHETFGFRSK
jgi:hypothetical protein